MRSNASNSRYTFVYTQAGRRAATRTVYERESCLRVQLRRWLWKEHGRTVQSHQDHPARGCPSGNRVNASPDVNAGWHEKLDGPEKTTRTATHEARSSTASDLKITLARLQRVGNHGRMTCFYSRLVETHPEQANHVGHRTYPRIHMKNQL